MVAENARVDEAGLAAWGREFARTLSAPAAVALTGDLGAGKTTLVKAIAASLGVTESVTSPTFALVHRYSAPALTVYHADAYRLKPTDDARDLGLDEMASDSRGILFVEWPERLKNPPPFTHRITLTRVDDAHREISVA